SRCSPGCGHSCSASACWRRVPTYPGAPAGSACSTSAVGRCCSSELRRAPTRPAGPSAGGSAPATWRRPRCCAATWSDTMPERPPPGEAGRYAYAGLDRVLHEKARLSIMTSLAAHPRELAFGELKQLCALTDGNLNRHLDVLHKAGLVAVTK